MKEEDILELCGILNKSNGMIYPTLAGLMIFGIYPQGYFPGTFIACCVIPGVEFGVEGSLGQRFDDNRRIEGTIEDMLEETLSFLNYNMKTKVIVDEKTGKRKDKPEYPMKALREAIANALIHEDFSIGAFIQVYRVCAKIK